MIEGEAGAAAQAEDIGVEQLIEEIALRIPPLRDTLSDALGELDLLANGMVLRDARLEQLGHQLRDLRREARELATAPPPELPPAEPVAPPRPTGIDPQRLEEAQRRSEELEEQLASLKQELRDRGTRYMGELKARERRVEQLGQIVETLNRERLEREADLHRLEEERREASRRARELEAELTVLRDAAGPIPEPAVAPGEVVRPEDLAQHAPPSEEIVPAASDAVAALKGQLDEAHEDVASRDREIAQLRQEMAEVRQYAELLESETRRARELLEDAREEAARSRESHSEESQASEGARAELDLLRAELTEAQSALDDARARLDTQGAELLEKSEALTTARAGLEAKSKEVSQLQEELEQALEAAALAMAAGDDKPGLPRPGFMVSDASRGPEPPASAEAAPPEATGADEALRRELDRMKDDLNLAEHTLTVRDRKIEALNSSLELRGQELQKLQETLADMNAGSGDSAVLEADRDRWKEQYNQLHKELGKERERAAEAAEITARKEQRIRELMADLDRRDRHIRALERELRDLKGRWHVRVFGGAATPSKDG